jgi:hypothetical protein
MNLSLSGAFYQELSNGTKYIHGGAHKGEDHGLGDLNMTNKTKQTNNLPYKMDR